LEFFKALALKNVFESKKGGTQIMYHSHKGSFSQHTGNPIATISISG
jgi:hypothetical protein